MSFTDLLGIDTSTWTDIQSGALNVGITVALLIGFLCGMTGKMKPVEKFLHLLSWFLLAAGMLVIAYEADSILHTYPNFRSAWVVRICALIGSVASAYLGVRTIRKLKRTA